jgi:hypothetical protein
MIQFPERLQVVQPLLWCSRRPIFPILYVCFGMSRDSEHTPIEGGTGCICRGLRHAQ